MPDEPIARRIALESFELALPVPAGEEAQEAARFTRLTVDWAVRVTALSSVAHATNLFGEELAVRLMHADAGEKVPTEAELASLKDVFLEGYRQQLRVSGSSGFPTIHGYGLMHDDGSGLMLPVIVMEWIESDDLAVSALPLPPEGFPSCSARTCAQIGVKVLGLLSAARRKAGDFVHRDLSPLNIQLRTRPTPISEQVARQDYDVCLINPRSAASFAERFASLMPLSDVWFNGMPNYAPPELLNPDLEGVEALWSSERIDVYALCCTLYELYSGALPFGEGSVAGLTPYRIKSEQDPEPLHARTAQDEAFARIVMAGIRAEQGERPSLGQLAAWLQAFIDGEPVLDLLEGPKQEAGRPSDGPDTVPLGEGGVPTGAAAGVEAGHGAKGTDDDRRGAWATIAVIALLVIAAVLVSCLVG